VLAAATSEDRGPARGGPHWRECLWLVGRLFPPNRVVDAVTTRARFEAPPDVV
jgi:hypothetical protein